MIKKNGGRKQKDKKKRLENKTFLQRRNLKRRVISRSRKLDLVYFIFLFIVIFLSIYFSIFYF